MAGHFYSDAEDYRDADEIARWREKDPVARYRHFLISEGVLREDDLDAIEARILDDVDTAFSAAKDEPVPGPDALASAEVYA